MADRYPPRPALVLLLGLAVVLGGCEINSGNPAGFDLTGRGPDTVLSDTLVVTGADTSWAVPLPLEAASRMLVGRIGGFEAVTLISFTDLPADAIVEEAALQLRRATGISEIDEPANLVLSVHPVTVDWDSTWSNEDLPSLTTDPVVDVFSMAWNAASDTIGFGLPTTLVQSWVDDGAAAARGVALLPDLAATWVLAIHSSETTSGTSRRPRLRLRWRPAGGGTSRIETFPVDQDLHLVSYSALPAPGELWLARGAAWRTLLTFDLSGLPPEATVNRALLRLHIFPDDGVAPPYGIGVSRPASATPWDLPPLDMVVAGTSASAVAVSGSDSTATIVVNRPLGSIVSAGQTDTGLLLFATSEFTSIGMLKLTDATAPPEKRARLEIIYSLPPGSTP
jgi:hypothetical protein